MLQPGWLPLRIKSEAVGIGTQLLRDIMEHRPWWDLARHECPAGITHQTELDRKSKAVVPPSPDGDFQLVGRRQGIVTDQAVLVGRYAEQRGPVFTPEKFPPGHIPLHATRADGLRPVRKRAVSYRGREECP